MFLDKLIAVKKSGGGALSIFDRVFGPIAWAGQTTRAGERVSPATMLSIPAMFRCVDNVSSHLAMLPMPVIEESMSAKGRRQRVRLRDHAVHRLLNFRANPWTSDYQFRKTLIAQKMVWGNGYAEIIRNGAGDAVELFNLQSWNVRPKYRDDGTLYYEVFNCITREWDEFDADSILHDAGLTSNGVIGCMISEIGRENIGLVQALETYAQTYFGNGGMPRIVLETQMSLGSKDNQGGRKLAASFDERHSGENKNRTAQLPPGVTAKVVGAPNDSNQLIESRKFSIKDACRWLNVPPHLVFEMDDTKYNNLFEMASAYIKLCLAPHAVSFEKEATFKLLNADEHENTYIQHIFEGLLRGDFVTRMNGYKSALDGGWMTRNEVRELEDMNPLDGLDEPLAPLNFGGASKDVSDKARQVAAEAWARMNRRIISHGRRAASKSDGFVDWIEGIPAAHRAVVMAETRAPMELLAAATGKTCEIESVVGRYFEWLKVELLTVSESKPTELVAAFDAWALRHDGGDEPCRLLME